MIKLFSAVLLLATMFPGTDGARKEGAEAPFKQVYARENVVIHERPTTNSYGLAVREIKVSFTAHSPQMAVVSMLRDAGKGMEWNLGASAYEVHEGSDSDWLTYIAYDLPWPLNDHDAVLQHSIIDHKDFVEVLLESVDGRLPVKEGMDRMQQVQGKWTVRQISHGLCEISYQVSSKPTNMPRLIVDPIVHYQMVRSMSALRELLETDV